MPIDAAALVQAGVIRRPLDGVRLLGHGEITAAIEISVAGATGAAVAAVERAGGKVNIEAAAPKPEGKLPKNEKKAAKAGRTREGWQSRRTGGVLSPNLVTKTRQATGWQRPTELLRAWAGALLPRRPT